mmetsp:Transcript_45848/g.113990  ORF Transcript_45848/g.113990 Transcript_45848/m.113990 type:complete len:220 (+) Transcript_45848:758-1417(+)
MTSVWVRRTRWTGATTTTMTMEIPSMKGMRGMTMNKTNTMRRRKLRTMGRPPKPRWSLEGQVYTRMLLRRGGTMAMSRATGTTRMTHLATQPTTAAGKRVGSGVKTTMTIRPKKVTRHTRRPHATRWTTTSSSSRHRTSKSARSRSARKSTSRSARKRFGGCGMRKITSRRTEMSTLVMLSGRTGMVLTTRHNQYEVGGGFGGTPLYEVRASRAERDRQ